MRKLDLTLKGLEMLTPLDDLTLMRFVKLMMIFGMEMGWNALWGTSL